MTETKNRFEYVFKYVFFQNIVDISKKLENEETKFYKLSINSVK